MERIYVYGIDNARHLIFSAPVVNDFRWMENNHVLSLPLFWYREGTLWVFTLC